MKSPSVKVAALLASLGAAAPVYGQSVSIPLQYVYVTQNGAPYWRLAVNVGINGGPGQLYVFDTGSASFNAAYNPATWNGFSTGLTSNGAPASTSFPQGLRYSYGDGGGYVGNIISMPLLNFYSAGGTTAAATLSASPGYQINALYRHNLPGGGSQDFPSYFDTSSTPPVEGNFYGTFGAGNFASAVVTSGGFVVGSVLGQTIRPNVIAQGYVVSANGQANPTNVAGGPVQNSPMGGSQIVSVGNQSQAVTACSPCVTVGLTPQIMGQFLPVGPASSNPQRYGAIPVAAGTVSFPNPYGGAPGTGNPSSTEFGVRLQSMLNGRTVTTNGLLDSGTPFIGINSGLSGTGGNTITVVGTNQQGQVVLGLPTSSATLTNGVSGTTSTAYFGDFSYVNTVIGVSFFMQNSVMFDLTDGLVSYTPYFVTDSPLATTASGNLTIGGSNLPLGLAGTISGPGGVTVLAGGNAQLSAVNTYTGATTINPSGKLLISGIGSIANSSGVANNGTFDISRAWAPVAIQSLTGAGQVNLGGQTLVLTNASGTFSGTIADGGSFNVAGGSLALAGGAFNFAGTGTYTGGTYVTGGSFQLSGTLNGGVSVGSNGSFTISPGGLLNNAGGTALNYGTLSVGGTMVGDLLNNGVAGNTGTIAGNVLNNGALAVNGPVTGGVFNNGTLSGTGTIAGNVINAGTMAPGNSIGTLNISGNYLNTGAGNYTAEVSATQSDKINVGGTATLQGGAVYVYAYPGSVYAPVTTYKLVSAAGGLSGTFGSVNEIYPFLQSSLSYDANNAYLTLTIGGFAAAAATPLQATVGAVLDANVANATGDFASVLSAMAVNVTSNAQGQAVLQSLSGNNYAGFSNTMVQGAQLFMNNFTNQAGGGQAGGGGSPTSTRVALAEACDVACDTVSTPKWGAWGGGLGGLGTIGGSASVGAVTYNAGGFATGLDRMITDNLRVGVTAGYAAGTQWVSGFTGNGRSDTFQTGLYANYAQDKVYADALLGYAYTWNQMWRQIAIPGLQPRTAMGSTGTNQFFGQVETGYRVDLGTNANAFVTPFARLQAYTGNQNAFTETGAQSLNLTVAQQTTNSLRTVLGAQVGGSMDLGWREKLAMVFRLGWSHEYADVSRPVTATLAGAPAMPFTTWGISPTRDGALIGLSANTAIAEATSVYFRYEGIVSGQDNAHAFTAGLRMAW